MTSKTVTTHEAQKKIYSFTALLDIVKKLREDKPNIRIGFTNGTFTIPHKGYFHLFEGEEKFKTLEFSEAKAAKAYGGEVQLIPTAEKNKFSASTLAAKVQGLREKIMSPHHEHHVTSSAALRDFVIGMSDGLTVPFALAAGLSGAVDSTVIIVTAGVAEIAAGAISMGLGGYLAAKTERDHYESERQREFREVECLPHVEAKEVSDILKDFGVPEAQLPVVVDAIRQHPAKWVDFMMKFELGLERPDPQRLVQSPLIIGGAYAIGGLVPLAPYFFLTHVAQALQMSIAVSLLALFAFGAFKGYFTGQKWFTAALQTTLIGSVAAAAALWIAKMVV